MTLSNRTIRVLVSLAIALGSVCLSARAWGQFEAIALGSDLFSIGSPINTKSLEAYGKALALDADQMTAAKELLKGYRGGLVSMLQDLKKKGEAFEDAQGKDREPDKMMEQMGGLMKEAAERNKKLESGFFEDLKSLLMPEQAEKWSRVERARRREVWQKFGLMYGESVDLSGTVVRSGVDGAKVAGLGELVDAYEGELDRIMQGRERMVKDYGSKLSGKKMVGGPMAFMAPEFMKPTQDAFKAWIQDGKKLRELNKSYQRRIMEVLPEDKRLGFDAEAKRRAFPPVYRDGEAQRVLKESLRSKSLGEEKLEELRKVQGDYEREAGPINEKWSKALEARQDASGEEMMVFMMQMGRGNDDLAKAVDEARKAREDLDKKYVEKALSLLTDEQAKAVKDKANEGRRRFGPDDGPFAFDEEDLEILEMLD